MSESNMPKCSCCGKSRSHLKRQSPPGESPAEWICTVCLGEDPEPKGEPMTDERQLECWVAGDSVHNSETDECCPDFSCCHPDLMWPVEDRKKFAEAYINEDSETTHLMCMDALGALVKSLDEKVHIAGENDGY